MQQIRKEQDALCLATNVWTIVYNNINTTLIRINKDYPQTILEIKNKTITFDEDTNKIIKDLK